MTDTQFETGEIHTFTVFADDQAGTSIPFMPDYLRLFVRALRQSGNGAVGGTSVAVTDGIDVAPVETMAAHTYWHYIIADPATGNPIGQRIRLTEDGYIFIGPSFRATNWGYNSHNDFVFGRISIEQNGQSVILNGTPTIFIGGVPNGTLDLSTLQLTLGGRIRGNLLQLQHDRIRGFYAGGSDNILSNPARDPGGPVPLLWRGMALDRGLSSRNEQGNYLEISPDEFVLTANTMTFSDGADGTGRCAVEFNLDPNINPQNEPTGTYGVTASITNCEASVSEYQGEYTGAGIVEATGFGGACLVLVVLTHQGTNQTIPFSFTRSGITCNSNL